MHVYRVVKRHVELAKEYVDEQAREGVTFGGSPLCCREHAQGDALPAGAAAGEQVLPVAQAPRGGVRGGGGVVRGNELRSREPEVEATVQGASFGGGHGPPRLVWCAVQSHRALYAAFDAVPSRKGAGVHIEQFAGTLFRRFGGGLPRAAAAARLARDLLDEAAGPLLPGDSPGREGSIWLVMHAGPPAEIRELFRRAERSRLQEDWRLRSRSAVRPPRGWTVV